MADFSHIAVREQAKKIKTAEIPIEGIEGFRPVLICKPATEDNAPYFNEMLKRQRRTARRRGRHVTVKDLRRLRDDDIELLPKHCVVGWAEGSVIDAEGKPVPYSEDECRKLFEAIVAAPNGRDAFDDFRNECADAGTFVEYSDDDDDGDDEGALGAHAGN